MEMEVYTYLAKISTCIKMALYIYLYLHIERERETTFLETTTTENHTKKRHTVILAVSTRSVSGFLIMMLCRVSQVS